MNGGSRPLRSSGLLIPDSDPEAGGRGSVKEGEVRKRGERESSGSVREKSQKRYMVFGSLCPSVSLMLTCSKGAADC